MSVLLARRPALGSGRAVTAVMAAFIANGLAVGSVGGLIPTLTRRLHTDAGGIGVMLVAFGAAAIVGINLGGRLSDARGALRMVQAGLAVMALGVVLLSTATALPVGIGFGLLYGLGNGMTDVSMNAMAVQVESARPRPLMSRFHATFSIGNLAGAALVLALGTAVSSSAALTYTVLGCAAVLVVVAIVLVERTAAQTCPVSHHTDTGARSPIPRAAWLLAAMAICFGIAEGTATDWSSVHVERVVGVSASLGALGLACVATFMVVVRLLGDAIVHRIGRRAAVRWGAAGAVLGYLIGVLAHGMPLVLLGWCVVGAGVALIAPQIYGLAGHTGGGRALSVVVTTGYVAFLVGPGVMGSLVSHIGIQQALWFPLSLAAVLSVLAIVMPAGPPVRPAD